MGEAASRLQLVIEVQGQQTQLLTQLVQQLQAVTNQVATANTSLSQVAENTNSKLTKALRGIQSGATEVLSAFGLWVTIPRAIEFVKSSIDRFAESERTLAKLSGSVRAAGGDFAAMKPLVDETSKSMIQYGVSNEEAQRGIADFVNRGFSVQQSLEAIGTAAKLATLEGIPVSEAINSISLASQGFIRPGSLLGQLLGSVRSELEKGGDQGENLRLIIEKLGHLDPAVEEQLGKLALQSQTLSATWKEFSENLGSFIARGLALKDNFKVIADELRKLNDEAERNARITSGTATASDNLETLIRKRDALATYRQQLVAGDHFMNIQGTENVKSVNDAMSFLGISRTFLLTDAQRKLAIGGLADLTRDLNSQILAAQKKVVVERNDATAALDHQANTKALADAQVAQKKMQDLLDAGSAEELSKQAELRGKILTAQSQEDEAEYQQKLLALKGNLSGQIALIEDYGRTRIATEKKNVTELATLLTAASEKNAAELQKLFKGSLSAEDISLMADAQATFSDLVFAAQRAKPGLILTEKDFKQAHDQFQSLETDLTQLSLLKENLARIGIKVDIQMTGDIKAVTDQFVQKLQEDLNRKLQNLKVGAETGGLSARDALTGELQLKARARNQLTGQALGIEGGALGEGRSMTDQETEAVAKLNAQIQELQPTLEEVAATSDNWLLGMRLGLKQLVDQWGSASQQIAGFLNRSVNRALDATADGIMGLIDGTMTWAQAFRQAAASIIRDIIRIVLQYVVGKIAMMIIDKVFHKQSQESAQQTAVVSGIAGVSKAGEQGGWVGVLIYMAVFAAAIAGIMALVGGFATGGKITGSGGPTDDNILIAASAGETVVNAGATRTVGDRFLARLQQGVVDLSALSPDALLAGMASPDFSGTRGSGGSAGSSSPVNVSAPDVHVVFVKTDQEARRYLETKVGRNHVARIMREDVGVQR